MEEIIRMQENLLLIRRTVGWTAEEFGEKIGVTRQTINNIESGRNKLTKTQYIAMRSILDAEMAQSPGDTKMLKVLLDVLVDHPENYNDESRDELLIKANLMAPSILAGATSRADVSKEWMRVAGLIVGGAAAFGPLGIGVGIATMNAWLMKAFVTGKKKPTTREKKDG
ncbi:MAG: helix-turn-helix domain-containing protein [Lachnospiraceae bacterium]|nr:helix-turn-helix domain-containing protein [Lachnospiraceae bacterium]